MGIIEGEHTFACDGHQNDAALLTDVLLSELLDETPVMILCSDNQACHRLVVCRI